jgi:hypothetical protein
MADLGAVGSLVEQSRLYPLGRNAYSLNRAHNPIGGIPVAEQALRPFPYPEDLRRLGGTVVHPTPRLVRVLVRNWVTHHQTAATRPDDTGAWSVAVPAGRYDIAYLADGRAPVCHGPYVVEVE